MSTTERPRSATWPVILITALFFFWGMANALNDILIPQFKKAFDLTDLQSGLVQSAFYAGYFVIALPAGALMRRFGYKAAILTGLGLFAAGAFLFYPAAEYQQYAPFLGALFIIACGLGSLETSANPLMTVLGDARGGTFRLNLAQAFNPVGCLLGIWIGHKYILSGVEADEARADTSTPDALHAFYVREAHAVQLPYLIIGAVIVLWLVLVALSRFPQAVAAGERHRDEAEIGTLRAISSLLRRSHFLFGVVAQFFYVGAQVGIWSYTIKYAQAEVHLTDKAASLFLIYHYIAFALGRFLGSLLMKFVSPIHLFALFATVNIVLTAAAAAVGGPTGLFCLVAASFFMSIMFPTIFAVSLRGLGPLTKTGASLLVMSIIGGAILTPVMGYISDTTHLIRLAIFVPALCFAVLTGYGLIVRKEKADHLDEAPVAP